VTTHYDDEAQAEQLKKWFKENWLALVAGLAVGLGAIFGWQGWQKHKNGHFAEGSQVYEDLKKELADNKTDLAKPLLDRLIADYADTPYAAAGQLQAAARAVRSNQLDEASSRLQWVREHAKDKGLQQIARLREARILWQQGKPDEALALLKDESGAFAPLFAELRGDIQLAKGERDAARGAYDQALQATSPEQPNRQLLQRKLDDLGGAAVQS